MVRAGKWRLRSGRWAAGALALLGLLGAASLRAQDMLQKALGDDVAAHWIYDDWGKAVELARSTGKPILALVRCVP
jgi:hypothetical protein